MDNQLALRATVTSIDSYFAPTCVLQSIFNQVNQHMFESDLVAVQNLR